jgi:hypothetical protein
VSTLEKQPESPEEPAQQAGIFLSNEDLSIEEPIPPPPEGFMDGSINLGAFPLFLEDGRHTYKGHKEIEDFIKKFGGDMIKQWATPDRRYIWIGVKIGAETIFDKDKPKEALGRLGELAVSSPPDN